jgi:hypothetical protein
MAVERTGMGLAERHVGTLHATVPAIVIALVVALLLAVAAALVVISRLSAGGESEFWKKVEHLERLRHDAPFDAVFIGHSIPLCAIDPDVVRESSGGLKTYNAALSTLFFGSARLWMAEFVVPNLRPKLVVLGLAGLEFNPHSTRMHFMEEYVRAQDARARWELGGLGERMRLLCTRPEVARYFVRRMLGRAAEPLPPPKDRSQLGPLGEERKHDERPLQTTERLHEALRDGIFTTYEFADSEVAKLRDFVAAMRAQGADVAVLRLVTMPNAVDYYPRGIADYDDAWARIRAVLDELDVALLEVDPSPFDESCFADVMHMNGRGKERYSRLVGAALAAHLGLARADR